ncbi:hypothetical protein ACE1B6_06330 [Aerosakkonemataceae cyanobacterium BLCC-F154]|uniref:Uncharacterized protein n=1 Tax=Floridaenema fluviatile BLCC-F154 TaxID=3153640 RepID=A0ABV4Y864_9CYAN
MNRAQARRSHFHSTKVILDSDMTQGKTNDNTFRVIEKSRITRVIGHLNDAYMEELATALSTILGLSNSEDNSQE